MTTNTPIDTSHVEHIIRALSEPPTPAAEVVSFDRSMAERILGLLENHPAIANIALSTCEEECVLRQALAEPKIELWAIHSVGPGEVYPCLSREHAEREAKEMFEQGQKEKAAMIARGESVEHWPDWVANVIPSPWEPAEHFEILAEETADHRNNLIARLEELEENAQPAPAQDELADSITMLRSDWNAVSIGMMTAINANMDLLAERTMLRAEAERLRAFANEIVSCAFEGGSFDGGDIQNMGVKHGLLRIEQRENECDEVCACREYGFPTECYRKTELLRAVMTAKETL